MPSSWTDGVRASGPVIFSCRCLILLLIAAVLSGCVTTKQRGDRAFEAGQYNEALDHYEQAIDSGSSDAELYYQAAQAAVRVGDFALAERYYSRALRHGGGEEVARALAEFYVATSNYTKAVRVLQRLLETTDEPQPIFNNLGAALMYADAPLDAESYLLIAQQMEPSDPVPYLNLGVLYDKHMNEPRLALGFYRCFLDMADKSRQHQKISSKVKAFEQQYEGQLDERFDVECGAPYRGPKALSREQLRDKLEEIKSDDGAASAGDGEEAERAEADGTADGETTQDRPAVDEDGGEDDEDIGPVIRRHGQSSAEPSGEDDPETAVELALEAYEAQDYADAVKQLEQVPMEDLDAHAMALYGRSLMALDEHERAQRWLAGAVEDEPSAENVEALLEVYRQIEADEKISKLCERFEGEPELEEVLEQCPKRQIRRHLKDQ